AGGRPATSGVEWARIFDLPLSGSIETELDDHLNLKRTSFAIHGDAGRLNYSDWWDRPREVKSLDIKADYEIGRHDLKGTVAADFGGPILNLSIQGRPPMEADEDLDFELGVQLDNWPMDEYASLWPKTVIPHAYDWIAANLSKGSFEHG